MYLGEFISAVQISSATPPTPGWRIWRIVWEPIEDSWLLTSASHEYRWLSPVACNGGPPKAGFSPHDVVADGSDAGFFAFNARTIARRLLSAPAAAKYSLALGSVQALGTVMEHEFGYRAQGVVVKDLEVKATSREAHSVDQMTRDLARRYRCAVRRYQDPELKPAPRSLAVNRLRMTVGIAGR